MTTCYFCNQWVGLDDPETYRMIRAWVHGKKADGAKLRERTPYAAHSHCIEKVAQGQAADQEDIFGGMTKEERSVIVEEIIGPRDS